MLEAGTYNISLRENSHDVIESVEHEVAADVVYNENHARSTNLIAATRQFADAEGNLTYLSRRIASPTTPRPPPPLPP